MALGGRGGKFQVVNRDLFYNLHDVAAFAVLADFPADAADANADLSAVALA